MKYILASTFLFALSLSPYSNSYANNLKGQYSSAYNKAQNIFHNWDKEEPGYLLLGLSSKAQYFLPINLSSEINNPMISPSIELFMHYDRFFLSLSTVSSHFKTKESIIFNISENAFTEGGTQLKYSLATIKAGYNALFKEKLKITPYAHFGTSDLFTTNYNIGNNEKSETIYKKVFAGGGIKVQYILIEKKPGNFQGVPLPKTLGISFDAGYNYQFSNISIPFNGHMGYISLGVFAGLSLKNNYK
jgi:hypothetical protein